MELLVYPELQELVDGLETKVQPHLLIIFKNINIFNDINIISGPPGSPGNLGNPGIPGMIVSYFYLNKSIYVYTLTSICLHIVFCIFSYIRAHKDCLVLLEIRANEDYAVKLDHKVWKDLLYVKIVNFCNNFSSLYSLLLYIYYRAKEVNQDLQEFKEKKEIEVT